MKNINLIQAKGADPGLVELQERPVLVKNSKNS